MIVLRVKGAKKEINNRVLFDNVDISIENGEHVAIIGRNGIGKTTLINCLLGFDNFNKGEVFREYPDNWGYLKQDFAVSENITLDEFIFSSFGMVNEVKKQLEAIQKKINDSIVNEDLDNNIIELNRLLEQYIDLDGYNKEIEVDKTLQQFGFDKNDMEKKYNQLSGGEKTKAQLARILLSNPKIIVLDEPTNHLDFQTLEWLEYWITNYTGTVIFISHDREFINKAAHTTYELTEKGANRYKGGFDEFKDQKNIECITQTSLFEDQERKKKLLKSDMKHYREWARKAHENGSKTSAAKHMKKVKSREKALKKIEENQVQKPRNPDKSKIDFDTNDIRVKTIVRIENLNMQIGDKNLIKDFKAEINNGERIAIMGDNGVGKSTFLKLLYGELNPTNGRVLRNPQLKIGYLPQEINYSNINKNILEFILESTAKSESLVRTILGQMLFRRDQVYKKVNTLSAGERVRLELSRLYCSDLNLLLLDEPTNYLDTDTYDVIEKALIGYDGTIILVTHDRYLLKKIANRLFIFENPSIKDFKGGFLEYKN